MNTTRFTAAQTHFHFDLVCHANDTITSEIAKKGYFDIAETSFISSLIQKIPSAVCIDIGANIGTHTLVMCKHAKSVHAFEP